LKYIFLPRKAGLVGSSHTTDATDGVLASDDIVML